MAHNRHLTLLAGLVAACLSIAPSGGCSDPPCGCEHKRGTVVHMALSCRCGQDGSGCPASLAEYLPQVDCSAGRRVLRLSGCGRITLSAAYGNGGTEVTFDATTGALLGVYDASGTNWGACNVLGYVYGKALFAPGSTIALTTDICDTIQQCTFCGNASADAPAC
jgi:hypothetical protein